MPSILDSLNSALGDNAIGQISQQLGSDPATTGSAVSAALPVLISALAKHSSSPGGADALQAALQQHDGSVLDDLASHFGGGTASLDGGAAILGKVLGTVRRRCSRRSDKLQGSDRRRPASYWPCSHPSCLARWDGTLASRVSTAADLPPPSVRRKRKPPRTTLRSVHSSRSSWTAITTAACSTMWRSWRADG